MTTFQERVAAFERAILADLGVGQVRLHRAFGVSNSAKVIEGGIQLAGVNLERFSTPEAFVLCSVIRFAPSDEVLFAVVVRDDLPSLERRLLEMRSLGAAEVDEGPSRGEFAARNNNVVAYLAPGGRLLLRNKGYWEAISAADAETQGPVELAAIHVACSTGSRPGSAGRGAAEFVRYLDVLAGDARIVDHTVHPAARPLRSWGVIELRRAIEGLGGYHPDSGIESLHRALCLGSPGRIAIIGGPAGSGKSLLALRYAEATGASVVTCLAGEGTVETLIRVSHQDQEPESLRPRVLLLEACSSEDAAHAARVWRSLLARLPTIPDGARALLSETMFLVVTLDGDAAAPAGVAPVVTLPTPDVGGYVHRRLQAVADGPSRPAEAAIAAALASSTYAEAEALLTSRR